MTQIVDFKLQKTIDGYYDIFVDGTDFAKTNGLDTALYVSVLTDAQASQSEQPNILARRGWWGDVYNTVSLGSKLWLAENRPLDQSTRNLAIDYLKKSLRWLIDENYADTVDVDAQVDLQVGSLNVIIKLSKNGSVTEQQITILGNT